MNRWQRRIERAAELAQRYPNTAEILHFYHELAIFQSGPRIELPVLLDLVRAKGTPVLKQAARELTPEHPLYPFFMRVLEQPRFEQQALHSGVNTTAVQATCPFCFDPPVVAIHRPEGD